MDTNGRKWRMVSRGREVAAGVRWPRASGSHERERVDIAPSAFRFPIAERLQAHSLTLVATEAVGLRVKTSDPSDQFPREAAKISEVVCAARNQSFLHSCELVSIRG